MRCAMSTSIDSCTTKTLATATVETAFVMPG